MVRNFFVSITIFNCSSLLSKCKTPAILQVKVTGQDRKSSGYVGIKNCLRSDFGIKE